MAVNRQNSSARPRSPGVSARALTVAIATVLTIGLATFTAGETALPAAAAGTAPVNTDPPVVSGSAAVGSALSVSNGTWTGTAPITYTYAWQRCGAGYRSSVLGDGPQSYWRLDETSGTSAANETGGAAGTYENGAVLARPGALSGDPSTSVGLDGANDDVAFANPSLTGPFTIELWAYLAGSGSTGATGYATVVGYDYTHRILWDTGGNGGKLLTQFDGNFFSSGNVSKNAWHQIVYSFDGTSERFYVDGAAAGSHATTLPTWQNAFLAGAYDDRTNYMFNGRLDELALYTKALTAAQIGQHYSAATAGGCTTINGATNQTYSPTAADIGATLTAKVTATNSAGNATATSAPTAAVTNPPAAPTNTALPTISGTTRVGQTLTADPGTWTGTAPITYAYQWRRCNPGCTDIATATNQTYTLTNTDLSTTLTVKVTATNTAGNQTATSNQTTTILAASTTPTNTTPPTVSGGTTTGQTLTTTQGSWSGTGPTTYAYQWRRCGTPYPTVTNGDGPQSYWRLGESSGTTAASANGTGAGTYIGGPALGQPGALPGDQDTAVGLDGVNDAVSMPNPNLTGPFTIELWAYLSGTGTTGAQGYSTLAGYDYSHRILLQIAGSSGRLLTQFDGNFFSTLTVSLKAWHHITYTFDGSAEHFYIDGAPAGSHPTTLPNWRSAYFFGAYDQANYMFNGKIDEAAVYAKALSSGQVVRHYEAGLAAGCRDIVGATTATHLLVPADAGATLQAVVTATNSSGSTSATSAASATVVAAAKPANAVTAENALPGTTAWESPSVDGPTIEGYTSQVSAAPGEQVNFHVSTAPVANYRVEIYRLGWYDGSGARLMGCLPSCSTDETGVARSMPAPNPTTGIVDAGWPVTDSVTVPSSWVSGYYMARLMLTTGAQKGSANSVYFTVRAAAGRNAAILVEAPVNTSEAYNSWGGKSLYANGSTNNQPAVKVSFNRPGAGQSPMLWEFPAIQFFEREGYDVSYTTNYDLDANPADLLTHKLIVSLGHDEYWTKGMRDALTAARDAGVNLAFLGGNDMYWQARYEDGGRTLVEYRNAAADPNPDPTIKTVRWRDLATPNPECQVVGVQDVGGIRAPTDPPRDYSLVAGSLGDTWMANTEFAAGATLTDLVGYEWDGIQPGCSTPPLTSFFHYGGQPGNGDMTRYTASSGARVFAGGSVQLAWGLDGYDGHDTPPDPRLQQLIRNAFASMTQ